MTFVAGMTICACAARAARGDRDVAPVRVVRVQVDGDVRRVSLEDYVRGAVLSEAAPAAGDEESIERMLEVQAIVSRTYALESRHTGDGFDLCSSTHCQLYDPERAAASRWASAADQAVRRTAGVIVWFADRPARIAFHADCGGQTSAAHDVWNGDTFSYLAGVADDGLAAVVHKEWKFAPRDAELLAALNGDPRTRVGRRLHRIDVLRRDPAGRAQIVVLDGERAPLVRGEELRTVLTRTFGARALRSTRFDVGRTDTGFEFKGRGFGHGVGLCQAGAFARVAAGASPSEVLAHYFPGTSIR